MSRVSFFQYIVALLLLATLTSAIVGITSAAEVVITAGTCKPTTTAAADSSPCIAGSILNLTGTDIAENETITIGRNEAEQALIRCVSPTLTATSLTCTIETEKSAVFGEYPITLRSGVSAGNIVYGEFLQQSIAGWNNHGSSINGTQVIECPNVQPSSGDKWLLYGTFDQTQSYTILFYNQDNTTVAGNQNKTPTCTTVMNQRYALSCLITVDFSVRGQWGILVQQGTSGPFLPGTGALQPISVNPALPVITSATGNCATDSSKCVSNTTLTFKGTNIAQRGPDAYQILVYTGNDKKITCTPGGDAADAISCTLGIDDGVPYGVYPITARIKLTATTLTPDFQLGNLNYFHNTQSTLPGWSRATSTSITAKVVGYNSTQPSTGDDWLIYGTFDTTKTYKVLFYNVDADTVDGNGGKTPLCTIKEPILPYSITCQITIETQVMGMWGFLVREGDDGPLVPGSTGLPSIAVNPPLPTATSATGDCATDSAKCITGNSLTITGTNFNARDIKNNLITIGTDNNITCNATSVTETELTCTLKVADGGPAAGAYPITVKVKLCSANMFSPSAAIGFLYWGYKGTPGWKAQKQNNITEVAPGSVTVGGELSFIGTFETAATYTVSFESVAAASSAVPQCKVTTVTATTVTCKYDGMLGVYGSWRPKLLANGFVLGMAPGTDAQTVTLEPLPPVVEDVSGDCAKDSKKCVTGAQLTFTGKGFNADAKRHRVTIDGMQDGECKVLQGTQQSIVCELTISASKSRASADDVSAYRMSLHTAVTDGNWLPTTAYIGTLMLTTGSDTIPGIVNTDAEPIIIQRITKGGGANKGLIACSVVFAVLLVAVCAGAAFVFWRYKLVKRGAEREHRDEEFWRDNDQQSIGSMPFHAVVKD